MTKLGNGLSVQHDTHYAAIYKNGMLIKRIDLQDAVERRILIIDLVKKMGAAPSKVATGLDVSRQTVYNVLDSYEKFGLAGLLHSGKNGVGNKARLHEAARKQEKEAHEKDEKQGDQQLELESADETPAVFTGTHGWKKTRYAGGMIFSALLEKHWQFTSFFSKAFGKFADVFIIFAQMLIHGVKSIEQLKAVKRSELGLVCGMETTPSRFTFSQRLRTVVAQNQALTLIKQFFVKQISAGLVNGYLLYADGHFIPYSGKERVHKGYFTQRRLMMPGQTAIVFHDATGRVVYFQIEEGRGDLKKVIESVATEIRDLFDKKVSPIIVSDRESWSVEHFSDMSEHRLLTWEKNTDADQIQALDADLFTDAEKINGCEYRFYEFPDKKTYFNSDKTQSAELRRIVIWNLKTDKRTVCVSNVSKDEQGEGTVFLARAILGRWGTSENSFKYMAERFNPHYIPLLQATEESEKQQIDNPIYKELEQQKKNIKTQLQKNATVLAGSKEVYNKNGEVRANSKHQRLLKERTEFESQLEIVENDLKATPKRIEITEIDGQDSFKVIDVEAKNLFDLVQAMVWNARRTLIDMLKNHYLDERDLVNLLDHVSRSHGWIKSTRKAVHVRLEPMDIPRFRAAQTGLCQALTQLETRLPNGKVLIFSVGDEPVS